MGDVSILPPSLLPEGPSRVGGRYVIERLVASGGMGSVYVAHDSELGETVALKILRRDLALSAEMLLRFRQEVKLARRVTHPRVARTFDIGEHDGLKFLTMELVDGESLSTLIARESRIPLERAIAIACELCEGLEAAHAAGVVHRDLKPDNVLLDREGHVKITDFGIARALDSNVNATRGMVVGTPMYIAPEQAEGAAVDGRTDIYAVGEILYEMLTGVPPWEGDTLFALVSARLIKPPPDPIALVPDLPTAASALIRSCMARLPSERPARVSDVLHTLCGLTLPLAPLAPITPLIPGAPLPNAASRAKTTRASERPGTRTHSQPPEREKSVAVLLLDAAEDVQHLADGFVEEVIDCLSMSSGVRVRTLGAVRKYRQKDGDPRDFGRALEVDLVASGSIRKVGDDLRITCRLVSVADGFQIWAKKLTCPPQEILNVASDAASAIASAITVDHKKDARILPSDPVVLDLYLRARHAYHEFSPASSKVSVGLYEKALALDPDSPVLLAGFAMAHRRSVGFSGDVSLQAGLHAATRALMLAPRLHEGLVAKAAIDLELGNTANAASLLTSAVRDRTTIPEAYSIRGALLLEVGLIDEGLADTQTSLAMEPRLVGARGSELRVCEWYESYGGRARVNALLEEMSGASSLVHSTLRARVQLWRKDRAEFDRSIRTEHLSTSSTIGVLFEWVSTGKLDPQFRTRLRSADFGKRQAAFFQQLEVEVAALLDARDQVLDGLICANELGLTDVEWLDRCPSLDGYRDEPRFKTARADVFARATLIKHALA